MSILYDPSARGRALSWWHGWRGPTGWLLASLLLLVLFQLGMTWLERQRLGLETEQVLADGRAVARQLSDSLHRLAKAEVIPCSMEDFALMAQILRDSQLTADIGRRVGDRLICSALRGQLDPPIRLPASDYHLANGISFITAYRLAPQDPSPLDLTLYQNVVVSTPPQTFDTTLFAADHDFYLLDGQQHYLFRTLGQVPVNSKLPSPNWFTGLQRCSPDGVLCVVGQMQRPWLYQHSSGQAWLGLVLLVLPVGLLRGFFFARSNKHARIQALHHAIYQQQIQVWYQPQVRLESGKVTGFEALSRWYSDRLGPIPPSEFIPLAEQAGLIQPLTLYVLEQAVTQCAPLLRQHRQLTLSINLVLGSALNSAFFAKVKKLVLSRDIRCEQLVFEITETSAAGFANIQAVCDEIKRYGFRLSLDDFGTGFSNLAWLSQLRTDEIKIDKMFIQALGEDSVAGKTTDMLLSLIADLPSVAIVLEGVETQGQVDRLKARGHHWIAQGWFYAKAMPVAQLATFLVAHGVAGGE